MHDVSLDRPLFLLRGTAGHAAGQRKIFKTVKCGGTTINIRNNNMRWGNIKYSRRSNAWWSKGAASSARKSLNLLCHNRLNVYINFHGIDRHSAKTMEIPSRKCRTCAESGPNQTKLPQRVWASSGNC